MRGFLGNSFLFMIPPRRGVRVCGRLGIVGAGWIWAYCERRYLLGGCIRRLWCLSWLMFAIGDLLAARLALVNSWSSLLGWAVRSSWRMVAMHRKLDCSGVGGACRE